MCALARLRAYRVMLPRDERRLREQVRKFTKKIDSQQMYVYFFEATSMEQGVAGKKKQQQKKKTAGSEDRMGRPGFLRLCRRYLRIPESEKDGGLSDEDLGRVFSYVDNFDRVPQQITGGQWVQFLQDTCVRACARAFVRACVRACVRARVRACVRVRACMRAHACVCVPIPRRQCGLLRACVRCE